MPGAFLIIDRLADLSDVDVSAIAEGNAIYWDNDTSKFKPAGASWDDANSAWQVPIGSAAAPSLKFGAIATGVWSPGTDHIGVAIDGNDSFRFSNGNFDGGCAIVAISRGLAIFPFISLTNSDFSKSARAVMVDDGVIAVRKGAGSFDEAWAIGPNTTSGIRVKRPSATVLAIRNGDDTADAALTALTFNKVTVTAPASGSTLTIADGATLSVPSSATISGTNTGDQFMAMTTNRLLGRSTAGPGAAEEISIGTGLQLLAGTLSSTVTATPGGSNTQLQYNNSSAFGGISGATSDGTSVTFASGNLLATSPKITTGLADANGASLIAFTATGSAIFGATLANAASGGTVAWGVTTPTQAASAIAGTPVSFNASNAVAGSSNAGAAAGGSITLTAGNAARLTSGDANGGNINLVPGSGIGTGTAGQVLVPVGVSATVPGLAFTGQTTSGFVFNNGAIGISVSNSFRIGFHGTDIRLQNGVVLGWANTNPVTNNPDVGISKSSAGVLQINNGTAGQWGSVLCGVRDAGTTTVVNGVTISHQSSGTPAAGFGIALKLNLNSSTTADQDAGQVVALWKVATHASRQSAVYFSVVNSSQSLTEMLRIEDISGSAFLSFGGQTSSFPALKRSSATLQVRLADDSAFATIEMGIPKFSGTNTTGAGTALLGANSPASTLSAPYTWIQATSSDGSTVYIPCWK